jgi:YgiT-type zinc finger domain-containing protein
VNCVICKHSETRPGQVTVTMERAGVTLIVKDVPAQICENCGEEYVDADTTRRLLGEAEEAAAAGVQVAVRTYAAA